MGEDIHQPHIRQRTELKIYKELKKLKILNNQIKKWGNEMNREFAKEEFQMGKRYLGTCSTFSAIRKMQIKQL